MTTEAMLITLSHQPADARWGEKASLTANEQDLPSICPAISR